MAAATAVLWVFVVGMMESEHWIFFGRLVVVPFHFGWAAGICIVQE
jgi:hypothetical protein